MKCVGPKKSFKRYTKANLIKDRAKIKENISWWEQWVKMEFCWAWKGGENRNIFGLRNT